MRILVSGSSGLVGQPLCVALEQAGHSIVRLVRSETKTRDDAIFWDPENGVLDEAKISGFDAVVHLAGEPIAAGRWTEKRKARIRDSRTQGTRLLCERIASCAAPPKTLIAASALGFYGNCGDAVVTEATPPGEGFLAEVCVAWEDATAPAVAAGTRVVNLRIGLVLSGEGGALTKMLKPFRMGLGGPLGDGGMWMSWIHRDDLVNAIQHCLQTPALDGPVNAFAPNPVTNKTFTQVLAQTLHRPAVLPVPATALRLAVGDMADELLLSSVRGIPERLTQTGFVFSFPELEPAMNDVLAEK